MNKTVADYVADYAADADATYAVVAAGAVDATAYYAARDLIYQYNVGSNDRWSTKDKAKTAGKYLYTLAKLRLI